MLEKSIPSQIPFKSSASPLERPSNTTPTPNDEESHQANLHISRSNIHGTHRREVKRRQSFTLGLAQIPSSSCQERNSSDETHEFFFSHIKSNGSFLEARFSGGHVRRASVPATMPSSARQLSEPDLNGDGYKECLVSWRRSPISAQER